MRQAVTIGRVIAAAGLLTAAVAAAEDFECLMTAQTEIALSPSTAGVIRSIEVERGDPVERNQLVAVLQSEVEQAEVDLARARAEFAGRKLTRSRELYRESYVSEVNVDEAITELRLAELELHRAQVRLAQKTLRSPIAGIVVSRAVSVGEFVEKSEVVRIASIDPLLVEVVLPVSEYGRIAVGERATVFPEAPLSGEYDAEVVVIDQVVDAASGTFGARLRLPNPDRALPAGLKCMVRFGAG